MYFLLKYYNFINKKKEFMFQIYYVFVPIDKQENKNQ